MGRVVAIDHVTLDGVMQSPGQRDEDPSGGFAHGGWAMQRQDPAMEQAFGAAMGRDWALLAGRVTYEQFADYWPKQGPDNPFGAALARTEKYVASRTLAEPLPWENPVLLKGDAAEAVADLKRTQPKTLVIFGSSELVHALVRRDLVDEFVLMVHPIAFGGGKRLFPTDGDHLAAFTLEEARPTPSGVVIVRYRLAKT